MGRSVSLVNSSLHWSVILSPSSCPYHLCFAVSQVMYYERLSPAVRGASSIANSSAHASPQESSQKVGGGREERKGGWRGGEELGCRGEEGRVEGRGGAGMQRGGRSWDGEGKGGKWDGEWTELMKGCITCITVPVVAHTQPTGSAGRPHCESPQLCHLYVFKVLYVGIVSL